MESLARPVLSLAHYFQAPATQAISNNNKWYHATFEWKSTQSSLASFVHHLSSPWSAPLSIVENRADYYKTARKFQVPPSGSLVNTVKQPIYANFQHLCSWDRLLNVVKIVLDPSLINAPCLIAAPYENYTKHLGTTKKEENHSIHSVSLAWFTGDLSIFILILLIDQQWRNNNPEGGFSHRQVRILEERYRSLDGLVAIFKLLIFCAQKKFVEW